MAKRREIGETSEKRPNVAAGPRLYVFLYTLGGSRWPFAAATDSDVLSSANLHHATIAG